MAKQRIFIAGHHGMVGSALLRLLTNDPNVELVTAEKSVLNLLSQVEVHAFLKDSSIDQIYLAAAKVGGIHANNTYPAEFLYDNLMIQANVIHGAHLANIQKLLFLGSSCIYPKHSPQPMCEDALLSGKLELTNEPYAIAKIAGIKLCESYNRQYGRDYRSIMPTNLYGPSDNYHAENAHVLPALIRRFHEAKINGISEVVVWGTGYPRREFLHVDDMAAAAAFVMNLPFETLFQHVDVRNSHINVGTGMDCSIRLLAEMVAEVTGFKGEIVWDSSKPDGTPRKLLDVSLLTSLGWTAQISLEEGLTKTYAWFLANQAGLKR